MMPKRTGMAAGLLTACLLCTIASADPMADGVALFDDGKYDEAVKAFEAVEPDAKPLPLMRYNAGIALLADGKLDEAIERLEDAAMRSAGPLRNAALQNLGYAWFTRATATRDSSDEAADDRAKLQTLVDAATGYRTAIDFLRMIRPEDEKSREDIGIAKTALAEVLDRIAKIEEALREKADEDALKEPAKLLFELLDEQRLHRELSRALAQAPARTARLASRRLRKSAARSRERTEMLEHHLATYKDSPSPDPNQATPQDKPGQPSDLEMRYHQAGAVLGEVIGHQRDAEASLAEQEFDRAADQWQDAIRKLRDAAQVMPLDLPTVLNDAIGVAGPTLDASRDLTGQQKDSTSSDNDQTAKSWLNSALEALGDKVIAPVMRALSPKDIQQAIPLALATEDVVWGAGLLSMFQAPESDPNTPQSDEQEKLTEMVGQIQELAGEAQASATQAGELLQDGKVAESIGPQQSALDALVKIAELLPKDPAEMIRRILQREQAVRGGMDQVAEMTEGQDETKAAMAQTQEHDVAQADKVSEQLSGQQDEKPRQAGELVVQAQGELRQSAQSLRDDRVEVAGEQTDRAIEKLKDALALLTGQQNEQDKNGQQQKNQQQNQQQQDQQQQDQSQPQGARMSPRQARMLMEELDRKRREQEEAILRAPSGITVNKDW